jgi:SpoVK/Ycf46/Vps4 family AAA+-type ATPase
LHKKAKSLLKTPVPQHPEAKNVISDLIPGKGNRLIVLLHGPPGAGVGKTVTAESLALQYGNPLYSISMSDVRTSATIVEQNLIHVFELATHVSNLSEIVLHFIIKSRNLGRAKRI